jgi:exoribonuclease-2
MGLISGCVIEFAEKGGRNVCAAVMSHAGGNVRLLLPNGKETKLAEKKVLCVSASPLVNPGDKEVCKTLLASLNQKRDEMASQINLEELYELVVEEERGFELKELSEFIFSGPGDDDTAALLRALSEDRLFFRNKDEMFLPASRDELEQLRIQLEKQSAREQQMNKWVEDLRMAVTSHKLSNELKNKLHEMKLYVAGGPEATINKKFISALNKAGLGNQRKLKSMLESCEAIKPDEDFLLVKYDVPVDFSDEANQAAEMLVAEITADSDKAMQRLDLTAIKTWAIDTPGSQDRDDAFSLETIILPDGNAGYRLYVHIADPSEFILPDSVLDAEACRRGSSIYTPDRRIHMLPTILSEDVLSLNENGDRFALSFILDFSSDYELMKIEIKESIVKIDRAIDYVNADAEIENNQWLQSAIKLSKSLLSQRARNNAALFPRQPEFEIKIEKGQIKILHRNRDSQTANMIAEFMIWANHAAAEYCRKNSIPCLYRTQESPEKQPEFSEDFDPVSFFALLKTFRKTVVSLNAGFHSSLGMSSYTQITSPLRRYADLLLHRQIKAGINGRPLPCSQTELQQRMLAADEAIVRADEIMREREKYFLCKYLKQKNKDESSIFNGIVVEVGNNDVTFYSDFLCMFRHCRKPPFDVAVGMKVGVRVNQVDLFDRIIRFDLVAQ